MIQQAIMEKLNVIIGNGQSPETLSKDIKGWRISKGRISSHLIFFDRISYFSGFIPEDAQNQNAYCKLSLPNDPVFANQANSLVVPFFSIDKYEPASQAAVEKISEGFKSVRNERWVCHPEILSTDFAARHPFAPSINSRFLDGLVCPPDSTDLDEVLEFRNEVSAERAAFFDALYRTCEAIEVNGKKVSVNIDVKRIELTLKNLNRCTLAKWASGVKRSFEFDVRPNAATIASLAAAITSYSNIANFGSDALTTIFGTIALSVSLTPKIDADNGYTNAMSFALHAKSKFSAQE